MTTLVNAIWKLRIWKDTRGQDFLEYALIAAFIATAYGAITPAIGPSISTVFSKVTSNLVKAGG
jgi:Flp pilus assembly pilin Flp